MKNRLNKIIILLSIAISYATVSGQIKTVNGFNYKDVNKNTLNANASCKGLSTEKKHEYEYNYTSFQLASKVLAIFKNSRTNIDTIVGNYQIKKRPYLNKTLGGETFRWILIRPNDNVKRQTIVITHGGKSGGASPQRVLSMGVYDYVQRGYAVVYYQSGSTKNLNMALKDAGLNTKCFTNVRCPLSTWAPDCDIDCFQQAVYLKTQFGVAALKYAASNAAKFNLNKERFFAIGFSGGGIGTMYSAFANSTTFGNPFFNKQGGLSALAISPNINYSLKAIATLAGGVFDSSSQNNKINPLFSGNNYTTRVIMFHGQNDFAVQPTTGPLMWTNPKGELKGSRIKTAFDLKKEFDSKGIKNKLIINCSACHSIFTWPCKYNDDCLGNNPAFLVCKSWANDNKYTQLNYNNVCALKNNLAENKQIFYVMSQVHDYSQIIAKFFQKPYGNTGPTSPPNTFISNTLATNSVTAINPKGFPFNQAANVINGHLEKSKKCLVKTCSGLYFNRDGLGLNPTNLLYSGDYVTIPATSVPGNIPLINFSHELSFKSIDHKGIGVLLSNVFGAKGIELFINKQGKIQFNLKDANGLKSMVGTTKILNDTCYNVVFSRDSNMYKLYLNKKLEVSKTINNNKFYIFNRMGNSRLEIGPKKGFNGIIKYYRVWNKAISPSMMGIKSLNRTTPGLLQNWEINKNDGVFKNNWQQMEDKTRVGKPLILGSSLLDDRYDPRWMENDEMCECKDDNIISLKTAKYQDKMFKIYPNPNKGVFNIESLQGSISNAVIKIYNMQGQLVDKSVIDKSNSLIRIRTKGIYIAVITWNEKIQTEKIIVE